jgi:hypothetical protein
MKDGRGIVTSKGCKVQVVNFIAGTKSMNLEAWNKAMETIGVPKRSGMERGKDS